MAKPMPLLPPVIRAFFACELHDFLLDDRLIAILVPWHRDQSRRRLHHSRSGSGSGSVDAERKAAYERGFEEILAARGGTGKRPSSSQLPFTLCRSTASCDPFRPAAQGGPVAGRAVIRNGRSTSTRPFDFSGRRLPPGRADRFQASVRNGRSCAGLPYRLWQLRHGLRAFPGGPVDPDFAQLRPARSRE